ncbi:sensor histidine kinase [Pseudoalteromonas sp. PPB1]|uniref:sensor histidine kinase n=1 Tax=Pseudoalteromonas sp. PPB1 TaxID=2756136 RepID=UPI001891DDE6|nr:sensor histidine kinase [Pseudoalteromonas sp. PPB1]
MLINFSPNSALGQLLLLRSIAIVLQLVLVLISLWFLDKNLPEQPIFTVIALESVFQLASIYAYRKVSDVSPGAMVMQLVADILFLTVLLSFLGGASNAFVSLLLLPCIIAAVTVPPKFVVFISGAALAAYGYLYTVVPMHHHGMHMGQHLLGMLVNFVFMVIVIVTIVTFLASRIQQRELALAKSREKQLQQEQVLALGSAAAQVTHQLATPIAHLSLLYEELSEDFPQHPAVLDMQAPLAQCKTQLDGFRAQTELLKPHAQVNSQAFTMLWQQLHELLTLQFPEQVINCQLPEQSFSVSGDPMLIPALFNLFVNAAKANEKCSALSLEVSVSLSEQASAGSDRTWSLSIRDHGPGIAMDKLALIGKSVVDSSSGLGMALLLSHATIERLEGTLHLSNHQTQGAVSVVTLPVV